MSHHTLRLPKRSRRLKQKDTTTETIEPTSVEDLVSRKRKKTEADRQLQDLFSSLDKEVEAREERGEFSATFEQQQQEKEEENEERWDQVEWTDHLLQTNHQADQDRAEAERVLRATGHYLGHDQEDSMDDIIKRMDSERQSGLDVTCHRTFFTQSVSQLEAPCLISQEEGVGQKEIHISELSATSKGIAFLFQSACLKEWHQAGWKCPHYVYQWLFQVIALEQDNNTAKSAFETLFMLWSLPGSRVETRLPHLCQQRSIHLDTFKSVLSLYHASSSELAEFPTSNNSNNTSTSHTITHAHLPLSQLGWMIKAFSFSIRLWSKAYTSYEIRYVVRLLLQISLDKTGYLVMQEIQTAIDNCLSAMDSATWETELKAIANDVCDMVESRRHWVYLLNAVKTIYVRSRYLRRMLGIVCLERSLESEAPGSLDYISTDQSVIQQIGQIFQHPQGFFMNQARHGDYEACYLHVALLDAAIGTDDKDIKQDKDIVLMMAAQLRMIGLQIGAKLGVMKKAMANEMIQRVWGRIFYSVGKDTQVTL